MSVMAFLIIVVSVVAIIAIDHLRFNRQVSDFIFSANELSAMYNLAIRTLEDGGVDVEFQGQIFYMFVEEGDYRSLVKQTELAVCTVLDKYDAIDKRYFFEMDDDLSYEIENLHKCVENIKSAIRYVKWQNGWK